jgi:hypothetical protein
LPPFDETSFRPFSERCTGAACDPLLASWRTDGEACADSVRLCPHCPRYVASAEFRLGRFGSLGGSCLGMTKKISHESLLVKLSEPPHLIDNELHAALGTFPAYGLLHERYPETAFWEVASKNASVKWRRAPRPGTDAETTGRSVDVISARLTNLGKRSAPILPLGLGRGSAFQSSILGPGDAELTQMPAYQE